MNEGTLCFERLQVLQDDASRDGAVQMALDEALMQDAAAALPTLRFYCWAEPTVSFGYFEPVETARRVARGRKIVRRLTGGGIVEHGDDLTFSLVVPRTDAFTRLRSAESYRMIHAAVARALERGGIIAHAHADAPLESSTDARQPNACFERPVLHDLMAGDRKVAGGAQRRTRAALLHQGSIRPNPAPDGRWQETMRRELPVALANLWEPRSFTGEEFRRAQTLAADRYATSSWTERI